jgi:predicted nucleic acid-binding protein
VIEDLLALPIERYPHDVLLRRAWEHPEHFSAYDGTYVALAEALADDPPSLLTADARFARALRAHTAVPALLAE